MKTIKLNKSNYNKYLKYVFTIKKSLLLHINLKEKLKKCFNRN